MPLPDPQDPWLPRLAGYEARRVPAYRAGKAYVCPACHNRIPPGVGHVVVWPVEWVEDRRHWHLHCWRTATRRGRLA